MKKTYMTPKTETIEVKTIGMLAESLGKGTNAVTQESQVLGRGGSSWDDEE